MTVDIGYAIDARMIRFLRNRTINPETLYWSERLGTHFTTGHAEWKCDEDHGTCWQLIDTSDAQNIYVKVQDDRAAAAIIRARIVCVEPLVFVDSRRAERYALHDTTLIAQEDDDVRRYMRHGRKALTESHRRRDPGTPLGRRFPAEPHF